MEAQAEMRVMQLRTDGGGEYVSGEFSAFLGQIGIRHQITPPHTP